MTGLSNLEIMKIVNRYIGVFGGYLGDFSYRTHADFYHEYCDLDINPYDYEGTTRERFIQILKNSPPNVQATIVRGVLERFPLSAENAKPPTRTQELYNELVEIAERLDGLSSTSSPNPKVTSSVATRQSLKVFLCHASGDKPAVEKYYALLIGNGIDAWLDKKNLIPGQNWQIEIPKAVRNSDIVIVFLSSSSLTKEGFVQKEIRIALDTADEKPDGTIFIIPARLENCEVPERLAKFHWVDLFEQDGYERIFKALQIRANNLGIAINKITYEPLELRDKSEFRKLVRVSPDGKIFAISSPDGSIAFFDNETKQLLSRLRYHKEPIHDMAFSPDAKAFFSTDSQGTIKWDLGKGILNAKIVS
jgi:WD40 repeat protein